MGGGIEIGVAVVFWKVGMVGSEGTGIGFGFGSGSAGLGKAFEGAGIDAGADAGACVGGGGVIVVFWKVGIGGSGGTTTFFTGAII